jgi:hypothetical protein
VLAKATSSITFVWEAPGFVGGAPLIEWELSGIHQPDHERLLPHQAVGEAWSMTADERIWHIHDIQGQILA